MCPDISHIYTVTLDSSLDFKGVSQDLKQQRLKGQSPQRSAEAPAERSGRTEALNTSCHLKHMAAAACGQRSKSQSGSGFSPRTEGGGPN